MINQVIALLPCTATSQIFIISPDHFHQLKSKNWLLSTEILSSTLSPYLNKKQLALIQLSHIKVAQEHGITALLPFIKEYCPASAIIPLIINQNGQYQTLNYQLGQIIAQIPESILLISSDFSHQGDLTTTAINDHLSLKALSTKEYKKIINDCPACWQVLSGFFERQEKFNLLAHRNSYDYSQIDQNITSYIAGFFMK